MRNEIYLNGRETYTPDRKYGDISNTSLNNAPLHQFRLEMTQDKNSKSASQTEMEFELPQRLDLGVSEKGVIGRQVTVREEGDQSWELELWDTIRLFYG